jgi:hypothetical protein
MKALASALLVLVAACGEGRVILNVDVLSFLSSSDSVKSFDVLGGIPQTDSTVSRQFFLPPGFGKSSVESVTATAAAALICTGGGGSVRFDVFFARTQGALFTSTPYLTAMSGAVVAGDSVSLLPPTSVSLADTVFNTDTLWVGIRARVATNVGPNMTGRLRVQDLHLRIALQDKVF